jgi:hypothetical protein
MQWFARSIPVQLRCIVEDQVSWQDAWRCLCPEVGAKFGVDRDFGLQVPRNDGEEDARSLSHPFHASQGQKYIRPIRWRPHQGIDRVPGKKTAKTVSKKPTRQRTPTQLDSRTSNEESHGSQARELHLRHAQLSPQALFAEPLAHNISPWKRYLLRHCKLQAQPLFHSLSISR